MDVLGQRTALTQLIGLQIAANGKLDSILSALHDIHDRQLHTEIDSYVDVRVMDMTGDIPIVADAAGLTVQFVAATLPVTITDPVSISGPVTVTSITDPVSITGPVEVTGTINAHTQIKEFESDVWYDALGFHPAGIEWMSSATSSEIKPSPAGAVPFTLNSGNSVGSEEGNTLTANAVLMSGTSNPWPYVNVRAISA